MKTFEPFLRYCSAIRHRFSLKMTTRCHSVFSRRSPVALSFQESDVATRRLPTALGPGGLGTPACNRLLRHNPHAFSPRLRLCSYFVLRQNARGAAARPAAAG